MSDSQTKPADDTRLFIVDDEGLLFSENQQTIYRLNASATFVWCMLETGNNKEEIIHEFAHTFSNNHKTAAELVDSVISKFESCLLLNNSLHNNSVLTRVSSSTEETQTNNTLAEFPDYQATEVFKTRCYQLLNITICIKYPSEEQFELIQPILAHLETNLTDDAECTIEIIRKDNYFFLFRNKSPVTYAHSLPALGPAIKGLVMQSAVNNQSYFVFIHGGIVSKNNRCLLMPGTSGSGKSTLAAALSQSGFQYMSDEIALLEETSFKIKPTPIAISAKSTGWDILKSYYPQIDDLTIHQREDGKRIRYIPPPLSMEQVSIQHSLPVAAIIFPKYLANEPTCIRSMNKIDAFQAILDDCLALPKRLSQQNIGEMLQWIKNTPCYFLSMSDLDEAVRLVQELEL